MNICPTHNTFPYGAKPTSAGGPNLRRRRVSFECECRVHCMESGETRSFRTGLIHDQMSTKGKVLTQPLSCVAVFMQPLTKIYTCFKHHKAAAHRIVAHYCSIIMRRIKPDYLIRKRVNGQADTISQRNPLKIAMGTQIRLCLLSVKERGYCNKTIAVQD